MTAPSAGAGTAGLRCTVLGSASPYPRPDNPCSGYLVSAGDTRIWLDAGTGTLGALQRHVRLDRLDAIWISHLHADHSADLLTAFYALRYADLDVPPVPLYCPPGTADRLAGFLTNGPRRSPVDSAFEIHELADGHRTAVGGLELVSRAVEHGMPAFAVRVSTAAAALAYSGDTAPCDALVELAARADLLLCEADVDRPVDDHHTPEQAGETAAAAGVARLAVTHVGPFVTADDAVRRAASRFAGPTEYARPGATLLVS